MNPERIDLNLLRVFQAIYETRSVTAAAERFGITQPAMSNALSRLRALCGDALFVPTATGMQPTPYAQEIAEAVAAALQTVQRALGSRKPFDPGSSDRLFRFHMTDMGQMYFLPPLLTRLQDAAPGVRVEAQTLPLDAIRDALEDGRIDFAFGRLPMSPGRGVRSQVLFPERYDVLARAGHPAGGRRRAREAFLAASHAVVTSLSGGHKIIEETLARLGARIVLRVPNFTVLPPILASTDIVVTAPSRLAAELARAGTLATYALPIDLAAFDIRLFWHERFEADPAAGWMRARIADLFAERRRAPAPGQRLDSGRTAKDAKDAKEN